MHINTVIKTFRPPFLILTPVCVFLGLSTALQVTNSIDYFLFFLVFIGATTAHISVNTLNEYLDFKSGLDLKTEKTPFSGGSGGLPSDPDSANAVLIAAIVTLVITILIGLYLSQERSNEILPIGIIGLILVITYTKWINRSPFLCLIAPGLGFGILMVVGTHLILTGHHSPLAWLISLIPFFLINNHLLVNQYPDKQADASIGRKTFPVVYGLKKSNVVYFINMLVAYLLIPLFILTGYLPVLSCISLIPAGLCLFSFSGIKKYHSEMANHPKYMAANTAAAILTPLLLAFSLLLK